MIETTPRREATRSRLIQAAIAEFAAHGVDGTSVEQISEAAGFTRGAFYSNFADKDVLIQAIVDHITTTTSSLFLDAVKSLPEGVSVHDAVRLVLHSRMISPEIHTTMLEIILRSRRDPELAERLAARRDEINPMFRAVLMAAVERLGLRLTVDAQDLIDIVDALYESSFVLRSGDSEARMIELTGVIATMFTDES